MLVSWVELFYSLMLEFYSKVSRREPFLFTLIGSFKVKSPRSYFSFLLPLQPITCNRAVNTVNIRKKPAKKRRIIKKSTKCFILVLFLFYQQSLRDRQPKQEKNRVSDKCQGFHDLANLLSTR